MNEHSRELMAQAILDMSAGLEFDTGIAAQCDALATSVGAVFHMQGQSMAAAETFIRDLAEDMAIRHIRRHWGTVEAAGYGKAGEA